MPKLKTKRAAAKRFKMLPSGKIKRDQAGHEHLATKKAKDRKNNLKKGAFVHSANRDSILRCLTKR